MRTNIRDLLENWPRSFIRTSDLAMLLGKSLNACYLVVKRALSAGLLIRMRRGLYLIAGRIKRQPLDEFELALLIYEPSFVSLESALSYHGWIPEAVYTTTCVSAKRAREFKTPVGTFIYKRVPESQFYIGVERIETESGAIFIASPWRAIADFMYTRRKAWKTIDELGEDLRIDRENLISSDKEELGLLVENYPSSRVRESLKKFLKKITRILQEDS